MRKEEQSKLDLKASDSVQRSVRQYLNQEDFVSRLSDSAEELYQLFENKYLNLKSVS